MLRSFKCRWLHTSGKPLPKLSSLYALIKMHIKIILLYMCVKNCNYSNISSQSPLRAKKKLSFLEGQKSLRKAIFTVFSRAARYFPEASSADK